MNRPDIANRKRLRAIAKRAMMERGLLPTSPPPPCARWRLSTGRRWRRHDPATCASCPGARSTTTTPATSTSSRWPSRSRAARVKILVAIADVDALGEEGSAIDAHARHNTTSVYTAAGIFPMLPERLSTDLTSLREAGAAGDGRRDGGRGRRDGRATDVYRGPCVNQAKLAYDSVAAWLDGEGPAPPRPRRWPGSTRTCACRTGGPGDARCGTSMAPSSLETPEARAVFDGEAIRELRRGAEPRQGADRGLHDRRQRGDGAVPRRAGLPRCGAWCARRSAGSGSWRWPPGIGERLPAEPESRALAEFLVRRRQAGPRRFPDLSLR